MKSQHVIKDGQTNTCGHIGGNTRLGPRRERTANELNEGCTNAQKPKDQCEVGGVGGGSLPTRHERCPPGPVIAHKRTLRALGEGVTLPDGITTRPARVRSLGTTRAGEAWLEVVLEEGRNRQVRHMCAAVGHDVLELVRVAIGGLALGDLASGSCWKAE